MKTVVFDVGDLVTAIAQRVAEGGDGFELGDVLEDVFSVADIPLGLAIADGQVKCSRKRIAECSDSIGEPGAVRPKRARLGDDFPKTSWTLSGDKSRGQAGIAGAHDRAFGRRNRGGLDSFEHRKDLFDDERGEGSVAGAFSPAGFRAMDRDKDKPAVCDFALSEEIVDRRGSAESIPVEFPVEENDELGRTFLLCWRPDPNGSPVVQMNAGQSVESFLHAGAIRRRDPRLGAFTPWIDLVLQKRIPTIRPVRTCLTGSAVDETLRYRAPKRNFRRVKRAHTFAGVPFADGEMVFHLIGSANRDPDRIAGPDRFNLHRAKIEHFSFGFGIHFCLGAPLLARRRAVRIASGVLRAPAAAIPRRSKDRRRPV